MNEHICRAIRAQHLLELEYKGHRRIVAPHIYGVDNSGDEMLSGFQIKGGSDTGAATGWKSLKVADIRDLAVMPRGFRPRPEFRRNDPAMASIFCQLD